MEAQAPRSVCGLAGTPSLVPMPEPALSGRQNQELLRRRRALYGRRHFKLLGKASRFGFPGRSRKQRSSPSLCWDTATPRQFSGTFLKWVTKAGTDQSRGCEAEGAKAKERGCQRPRPQARRHPLKARPAPTSEGQPPHRRSLSPRVSSGQMPFPVYR